MSEALSLRVQRLTPEALQHAEQLIRAGAAV